MGKTGISIATLMMAGGIASGAMAMGPAAPFITERADGMSLARPASAQTVPMLRSSSAVTLGDDMVTQDGSAMAHAAPAGVAYSAMPAAPLAVPVPAPMVAPPPSLLPPPPPAMPMVAAPGMEAMPPMAYSGPPMAHPGALVDRREYKRAMKQRRAYERALRRCGSDCRALLGPSGPSRPAMAWNGAYGSSAYYGVPMQPPAPVVTHGEVPGMAGARYEQTQYAGQYANGYYYPGQTVTKITIDPGTMVVTQPAPEMPAPEVSTYYAEPAHAATPRRAKAARIRSKLVRRCAC